MKQCSYVVLITVPVSLNDFLKSITPNEHCSQIIKWSENLISAEALFRENTVLDSSFSKYVNVYIL